MASDAEIRCVSGQKTYSMVCTRHSEHYWCGVCEGYYGVSHEGIHGEFGMPPHPRGLYEARQCACRPCRDLVGQIRMTNSYDQSR